MTIVWFTHRTYIMTRRAVDDFGDRLVFDEDDLRWKELFSWESLKSYLRMKGEEFSFVRELIVNNQYTSNFQRLVDQILSRLKALEKSKGSKPPDTVFEVCAGFCLVLAILQQATQKLSAADVSTTIVHLLLLFPSKQDLTLRPCDFPTAHQVFVVENATRTDLFPHFGGR